MHYQTFFNRLLLQLVVVLLAFNTAPMFAQTQTSSGVSDANLFSASPSRVSLLVDRLPCKLDVQKTDKALNESISERLSSDRHNPKGRYELVHSDQTDFPVLYQIPLWAGVGIFVLFVCWSMVARTNFRRREQAMLIERSDQDSELVDSTIDDSVLYSKHDVKNMLTAIVSAAELGKLVDDPAQKDELFETIMETGLTVSSLMTESSLTTNRERLDANIKKEIAGKRILFVDDDQFVRKNGRAITRTVRCEFDCC